MLTQDMREKTIFMLPVTLTLDLSISNLLRQLLVFRTIFPPNVKFLRLSYFE